MITVITYPQIIGRLGGADVLMHSGNWCAVRRYMSGRGYQRVPWSAVADIACDGLAVWAMAEWYRRQGDQA